MCDIPQGARKTRRNYIKLLTLFIFGGGKRGFKNIFNFFFSNSMCLHGEQNSLWVKNELIHNLEEEDNYILIFLPMRNFCHGKSITENIISCTEKSCKYIFVLSSLSRVSGAIMNSTLPSTVSSMKVLII